MVYEQAFTGWVLPNASSFGGPWQQGGNSFGAVGILGTLDAFPLTFIVNGAETARFTTGGAFLVGYTAPYVSEVFGVQGSGFFSGELLVNGATVLSDETLSVIGGIASQTQGLEQAFIEVESSTAQVSAANSARLRYNGGQLEVSYNGAAYQALISSGLGLARFGNVVLVDAVNGNDGFGAVNSYPFLTLEAAINYVAGAGLSGVTIWVMPGTYNLTAGITIPAGCALRGSSVQTTRIQLAASNPGGSVTMITMGANTRVEDVTLTMTSSNATTDLVGIALPGTTSLTAKLRTATLTVNNSGVPTGSTTNVYGILSNGNATISSSSWTTNFTRGVTVSVLSNGGGRKRAVYCSTASVISFRDTNLYCAPPVDAASTGSYVGVETANNSALVQLRTSTIGGGIDGGGAYTGADVLQTAPATGGGTTNYGVYVCDGTDLINHRSGGAPISTTAPPSLLEYSLRGNVQNAARYYWQGNQTAGDATETFTRAEERLIVYGVFVNLRTAPGLGQTVTVRVRKSLTGVPGSGVATTMVATISGASTSGQFYGTSVEFNKGDYLSVQSTATGGVAADMVIQVNVY